MIDVYKDILKRTIKTRTVPREIYRCRITIAITRLYLMPEAKEAPAARKASTTTMKESAQEAAQTTSKVAGDQTTASRTTKQCPRVPPNQWQMNKPKERTGKRISILS